jgi:CubicO group peptidase (beta-lactamase class C family)
MRDGLAHRESYEPWSAVPRMLWGVDDAPAYAGSAPADAPPGTRFRYLSATANILSRLLRAQFASDADYWRYPREALFDPIGASSAVLESTAQARSSAPPTCGRRHWTGRASARCCGETAWPASTVSSPPGGNALQEHRRPRRIRRRNAYGAHVWLAGAPQASACGPDHGLPADTFLLSGHWSQIVAVVPSREVVIVRLGMTLDGSRFDGCAFIRTILGTLPSVQSAAPDDGRPR